MRICAKNNITFQRRLKNDEISDYQNTLIQAKNKVGNRGKSLLIVPSTSLPNKTGVGCLGTEESAKFFNFAKTYWGINEIQLLPVGQYHCHNGEYPIYSGTSMDLGEQNIDIKKYAKPEDYSKLIDNNKNSNVRFENVVGKDSPQEKILHKIYENGKFKEAFEVFKKENESRLEAKALYRALRDINNTNDYTQWNNIDKNLFNSDLVTETERKNRINEIKQIKSKDIDFYYFKQFLAEDSLKNAKNELNKNGLKLNADMLCGFSYDEIWANPKAFHKNTTIGWGLPALNLDMPEGEKLLREKVNFYAKRFDGIRVDAAWTYVMQPQIQNNDTKRKFYDGKILDIIEEEAQKVKGKDFKNIMYEFATSGENFSVYDSYALKPCVKDRIKIYTSDYLSQDWGSNDAFLKRSWAPDSFIIGATNHDSGKIKFNNTQAKVLADILKIPQKELQNPKEFIQAKFAEPTGAYHNMIFFSDALGLNEQFLNNEDKTKNYRVGISKDFENTYFKALENKEGYNPMDALAKNFKAQGLDKTDAKLYKKILKYKKILEQKENYSNNNLFLKIGIGIVCAALSIYGGYVVYNKDKH